MEAENSGVYVVDLSVAAIALNVANKGGVVLIECDKDSPDIDAYAVVQVCTTRFEGEHYVEITPPCRDGSFSISIKMADFQRIVDILRLVDGGLK